MYSVAALILPLVLFLAFDATAAESLGWPHIRGTNYDGVSPETGLASEWPEQGPPVLWVKELGQGYSSIVVQNNRAYTQYQTLAGQFVLCMDANTGKTIWSYRYDWPFEATGLYPGPFSTPTLSQGHVFFTTPSGAVGCLTLSGKRVWLRELKKEFDGQGTDFGYACSPTVVDGKVILPVGGRGASIVALDAASGATLWTTGDEPASYTPILPITIDGQRQVVGYLQHDLVGCDMSTGEQRWKKTLSRGYDEHSAWPIYREPFLWTSAPFQSGSRLWKLTTQQGASCQEVWHTELMSNDVSSSVLVDGTIYGFDLAEAQSKAHRPSRGAFRAIDFLTGEERWANGDAKTRRPTDLESGKAAQVVGHASLLAADGKLFLLNDLGDLILAEASPDQYVELGRARVLGGEIGWASPALDNGRLFVRNRSRAVCLYVGSEKITEGADAMSVGDLPQGTVRDYSRWLGVEPEYAMDAPTRRWLRNWYFVGAGILMVTGLVVLLARVTKPHRISVRRCRTLFVVMAFVLGVVVGPPASLLTHDFIFSWPVSLFVVFTAAVYQSRISRSSPELSRDERRSSRMIAFAFLLTCATYFVVCRRLSLVTQWTFLGGFPAAVPVILLDRYVNARIVHRSAISNWSLVRSWISVQVAFAMYFGLTTALLAMKYDLADR
jgi:outer membrane protein assembly factor BamB